MMMHLYGLWMQLNNSAFTCSHLFSPVLTWFSPGSPACTELCGAALALMKRLLSGARGPEFSEVRSDCELHVTALCDIIRSKL